MYSYIMSPNDCSKIFDIDRLSCFIFIAIVPYHKSTLFADPTNQIHIFFCDFIIIIFIVLFTIVVICLGSLLFMHCVNFLNDIFLKITKV